MAIQVQSNSGFIHHADVLNFILLLLYIQASIRRMLSVNVVWQTGHISLVKLLRLINLPPEQRMEPQEMLPSGGKLTFERVTFQYPSADQLLFKEIGFTLEPGTITWLHGKQGSGKSTLLKLIQGIYSPGDGKIFLDQLNYSSLTPNAIRKNVTIVSNETPLIGDTVFKAISYSRNADKRDKAVQMLERLGFSTGRNGEEILDQHLDDFARNLSAGQRKQLMFARAFLTRKKIILIDDAFDDLDSNARERVIAALHKLKAKRTIIIAGNQLPESIQPDQTIDLSELHPKIQLLTP